MPVQANLITNMRETEIQICAFRPIQVQQEDEEKIAIPVVEALLKVAHIVSKQGIKERQCYFLPWKYVLFGNHQHRNEVHNLSMFIGEKKWKWLASYTYTPSFSETLLSYKKRKQHPFVIPS